MRKRAPAARSGTCSLPGLATPLRLPGSDGRTLPTSLQDAPLQGTSERAAKEQGAWSGSADRDLYLRPASLSSFIDIVARFVRVPPLFLTGVATQLKTNNVVNIPPLPTWRHGGCPVKGK